MKTIFVNAINVIKTILMSIMNIFMNIIKTIYYSLKKNCIKIALIILIVLVWGIVSLCDVFQDDLHYYIYNLFFMLITIFILLQSNTSLTDFIKHMPYNVIIFMVLVIMLSIFTSMKIMGEYNEDVQNAIIIASIFTIMFYSLYIVSLYQISFNMFIKPEKGNHPQGTISYKKNFSNPLLVLFSAFILFQSVFATTIIIFKYDVIIDNKSIFNKSKEKNPLNSELPETTAANDNNDSLGNEENSTKDTPPNIANKRNPGPKIYRTVLSVCIALLSYTSMMFLLFIIKMFEKRLFTQHYNNYFFVAIGILLVNGFIVFISSQDGLQVDFKILSFVPSILLGIAPNLLFIVYNTFRQYKGVNNILNENLLLDEITTNASKRQIVELSLQQHNLITVGDILAQPYNIYKFLLLPIVPAHNSKLISIWIEKLIIREILGRDMYRYVTSTLGCNNLYRVRQLGKQCDKNISVLGPYNSIKDGCENDENSIHYKCRIKGFTQEEVINKIEMSYWKVQEHINNKFDDKDICNLIKKLLDYVIAEREGRKHTDLDNDIRKIDDKICPSKKEDMKTETKKDANTNKKKKTRGY